jgi:hypothetical protein
MEMNFTRLMKIFTFLWFTTLLNFIFTFGYQTHYFIGISVEKLLSSKQNYIIRDKYIGHDSNLGIASVWADTIKRKKEYRWTSKLHYINIIDDPPDFCGLVNGTIKDNVNMLSTIKFLIEKKELNEFEFKMLLHLFQDMHQPLHYTVKKRGGNSELIIVPTSRTSQSLVYTRSFSTRKMSLHSFFDSFLMSLMLKEYTFDELSDLIVSRIKEKNESCSDINNNTLMEWAQEIADLNCVIWKNDVVKSIQYMKKMLNILLDLLLKVVFRQYCLLDYIVDDTRINK